MRRRETPIVAYNVQRPYLAGYDRVHLLKQGRLECEKIVFHTPPGSTYSLDGDILKSTGDKLEVELGSTFDFATLP